MIFDRDNAPVGSLVLLLWESLHGVINHRAPPFQRVVLRWAKEANYVKLGKLGEASNGDEPWYDAEEITLIEVLEEKV
jgi:hypothetical protein